MAVINRENPLQIQSFGSSSAGNCTVIWSGQSAVMIDFGFYPSIIKKNLERIGKSFADLSGVLITHSHGDHINKYTLRTLIDYKIPVYCHESVFASIFNKFQRHLTEGDRESFRQFNGNDFVIEPFGISAFEVPHDSEGGCYGFNIYRKSESGEKKITISTDMGYPGGGLVNKFVNSDAIIIESNHDPEMLENSNRPWFLKKRITEIGHLSNEQCAGFLVEIMKGSDFLPGSVLLYHISQQCNTNKLAEECTRRALDNNNFKTVKIVQTFKDSPSNVIKIY